MKKLLAVTALVLAGILVSGVGRALAQNSSDASKPSAKEDAAPVEAYRLDFSVNELEDGKKINTRQYSMNLNANDSNEIKIGTRVPVEAKAGEFQYMDVGTSIWSRLGVRGAQLELAVRCDISNFAITEQASGHELRPMIRQMQIKASTVAVLGKTMVIGSVDDPNSKRQFQLDVTVTKLR